MQVISKDELHSVYLSLTDEQKHVLDEHVKRGIKTKWLNAWAKKLGNMLSEQDLICPQKAMDKLEWHLLDFEDNLIVDASCRCECGRPLRYRYTVLHKTTGQIYKLGTVHFEQHTGLGPEIIRLVIKGQKEIDLEKDEILKKVKYRQGLSVKIPLGFVIPIDMIEQLNVRLPLLDRQEKRLQELIIKYNEEFSRQKEIETLKHFDIVTVYNELLRLSISANEAKFLFEYLKSFPNDLYKYNLSIPSIKNAAKKALGYISNKNIREWLTEIEYMQE